MTKRELINILKNLDIPDDTEILIAEYEESYASRSYVNKDTPYNKVDDPSIIIG